MNILSFRYYSCSLDETQMYYIKLKEEHKSKRNQTATNTVTQWSQLATVLDNPQLPYPTRWWPSQPCSRPVASARNRGWRSCRRRSGRRETAPVKEKRLGVENLEMKARKSSKDNATGSPAVKETTSGDPIFFCFYRRAESHWSPVMSATDMEQVKPKTRSMYSEPTNDLIINE